MENDFREGVKDGFPVFLGYFPTAVAFGLFAANSAFTFSQTLLMSVTNYAGAGQFLAITLYNASSTFFSIIFAVFLLNSRYFFMASSLSVKVEEGGGFLKKILAGFGTTDELFAVASFKGRNLTYNYIIPLWFTMYAGWISGTAFGFLLGAFLPPVIQAASQITCYAMFASILGSQVSSSFKALFVASFAAICNTFFRFFLSAGLSFLFSVALTVFVFSFFYSEEEIGL